MTCFIHYKFNSYLPDESRYVVNCDYDLLHLFIIIFLLSDVVSLKLDYAFVNQVVNILL